MTVPMLLRSSVCLIMVLPLIEIWKAKGELLLSNPFVLLIG